MNKYSFTAVDFETATHDRYICQIGLVVVKEGQIIERFTCLVKPPHNLYDRACTQVHHIQAEDTIYSEEFDALWPKISPYFVGTQLIAHNASFDEDALKKTLKYYGISTKEILPFKCTCSYFHRASLRSLCAGFGIPYNDVLHHTALFDAECCAEFALKMLEGKEPDWDLVNRVSNENKHTHMVPPKSYHEQLHGDVLVKDLTGANPENPFYNKKIVITGVFTQERKELGAVLKSMGADIDSSVTKRTDFVLVGESPGPAKLKKIETLNSTGSNISILNQNDLDLILEGNWEPYKKGC